MVIQEETFTTTVNADQDDSEPKKEEVTIVHIERKDYGKAVTSKAPPK